MRGGVSDALVGTVDSNHHTIGVVFGYKFGGPLIDKLWDRRKVKQ